MAALSTKEMTEYSGDRQVDGRERIARIQDALKSSDLDVLIATLPSNILMLSGYCPVIGTAIAVATKEGEVAVLAPEDELRFAQHGWAHRIRTFQPASLSEITSPSIAVGGALRTLMHDLGVHCSRIGYELGEASEPATYAAMFLYAHSVIDAIRVAAPSAPLAPADLLFRRLTATKTSAEVDRIRLACRVAGQAYESGQSQIRLGAIETGVAALCRSGFSVYGMAQPDVLRADGCAWCMSGPNSAEAGGAFAHSRHRKMERGDFVLVHSNSYVDGYWTDITRTQVLGDPDAKQKQIFAAIAEARQAAFSKIKPGVRAAEVDLAARQVIAKHGFGDAFTHSTGHGVGFAAISANAHPRIHPKSDESLETGMTFNIEPSIYIQGYGGARHCDMVAVTESGIEVLTDFQPITT
jgi:Xaa-Pro aminopeptidase